MAAVVKEDPAAAEEVRVRYGIINEEVQKIIDEKIATARDNPVSKAELKRCCADHIPRDEEVIYHKDRRPGWVHPPSQEVVIGDGHRVAVAFEERGERIYRHVAVTLDDAPYGAVIDKMTVMPVVARAFRIEPRRVVSRWLDEYEPGKWRHNYLTIEPER